MLDMGFIHDIRKVLALVPKQKQTLLFSATFSDEIRGLANGLLRDPQLVEVAPRNATVDLITQRVYPVDKARKRDLLIKLIDDHHWHQVLVFMRTKHGANTLAEKLNKADISAAAIHGNKSQGARTRALADFKSMKLNVLVATDIAARGLDIDQLPHVVNFELPNVPEDYVHRIGRTGRAGAKGIAISFAAPQDRHQLRDIERYTRQPIQAHVIEGLKPSATPARDHAPNRPRQGEHRHPAARDGQRRHTASGRPARSGHQHGNAAQPARGDTGQRPQGQRRDRRDFQRRGNGPQLG